MALNFADAASKKMDEIERPPLPPVGTYRFRVTKLPTTVKRGKDEEWEVVSFPVQAQEALDNVDMDDYKGDVLGIFNNIEFMFDTQDEVKFEQTLFRMKTFLEKHLGIQEDTIAEAMNESVGAECLGDIGWDADKNDPEMFYARVKRTAPLD